jgi:hypothetical protein
MFALAGCAASEQQEAARPTTTIPHVAKVPSAPGSVAVTPPEARTPSTELPEPCGAVGCLHFPSAEAAFDHVLQHRPRVLAIGEAHLQRENAGIASTTRRFTERLLPRLRGEASDLIIELWVAAGQCGEVERDVAERQRPVTGHQAAGNQQDFLELGHRAKALGIRPHALVPSCEQYREIVGAGARDIEHMLQMLAETTARDVERLLAQQEAKGSSELIVAYGGALHNDLTPKPGREHWSFGPRLDAATAGKYVELDLFVPEQIQDTDSWRALPWHSAYRDSDAQSGARLYAPSERAFALILPPAEQSGQNRSPTRSP